MSIQADDDFDFPCQLCGVGGPTRVYRSEARGRVWFTDGIALFRGAWPGEHEVREGSPDVARLLAGLVDVFAPVEVEVTSPEGSLHTLSSGAHVSTEWWDEMTEGRGLAPHNAGVRDPIVFRDASDEIAGLLMPVLMPDTAP